MSYIYERLREIVHQSGRSQASFAEMMGISLSSQKNYEKGLRKPDIEYLTRLYEAGFDVVYLLTGERSVARLSQAESELLVAWRKADLARQFAAYNALVGTAKPPRMDNGQYITCRQQEDGDNPEAPHVSPTYIEEGGDPEAFFKAHRDKINKINAFRLLLSGAALYLLPLIFSATGVELFGKQEVTNMQAFFVYLYTVIGIMLVSIIIIGYGVGVHIRNAWLLMPVYKWCRYNVFDQLWRRWQGDPDGEGKKARAKIRLWHAFNDRETAKERYHANPTKRRKAKMETLETRWQEKYRAFLAEYGFCASVV